MRLYALAVALFVLWPTLSRSEVSPETVFYLSGNHTLQGHLYKPKGPGPFPSIVFNQSLLNNLTPGQEKPFQTLAQMFTSKGWVFFVPGRHTLAAMNEKNKDGTSGMVRAHEKHGANIAAAVSWLKTEDYIDSRRVVVMGEAAGGVSSLFAAENDMNIAAMVLFAPGIQSLKNEDVKERMKGAASRARFPIFLIQTQGDNNLQPTNVLGLEMEKKGGLDRFKVYAAYGTSHSGAQKFPAEGYGVWQADFFDFVGEVFGTGAVAQKVAN
jgi:dienelactone hydrolase